MLLYKELDRKISLACYFVGFSKRDGPFINTSVGGGSFMPSVGGYLLWIKGVVVRALSEASLELGSFF